MKHGKKYVEGAKLIDRSKVYDTAEALDICVKTGTAKFDETVELHVKLGVDGRHADQQVRGAIVLPNGTGKSVRVLAICKPEKEEDAKAAGADYVGGEEMVQKIQSENWMDFDVLITTPDMMGLVGRLGRLLGPRGLMPNPKAGTVTPDVGKAVTDAKIVIKLPAGTPEYVSNSFVSLLPGFVILFVTIALRALFGMTPWGNIFDCLYSLLQAPLTAIIGNNVLTMCFFQLITQVLWVFGIHPGFLTSLTGPVLFGLDGMNQAAYAAGEEIPSVIGMAFSYSTTIAIVYPAFAVALILFSKSGQLKTVGKVAAAPAFFGISEPLIFGIPVVFNPIIAIPWIAAPIVNFVLGYIACSSGLVAKYAGVTVFNFPMVATGLLNGSISIALMEVVLFVIDVLIYMPFVRIQDKKNLMAEKAAMDAE